MGVDTLRHHFCDVAAGLRATPRCWEMRHSLWYWLGRISKASRIDKGERTCPVQAVARGLDTKVRGPLYDFFIKVRPLPPHRLRPPDRHLTFCLSWSFAYKAHRQQRGQGTRMGGGASTDQPHPPHDLEVLRTNRPPGRVKESCTHSTNRVGQTEAGRRDGPAFPFFTIWYKQEGEGGVIFTEDDFRNLSSTGASPTENPSLPTRHPFKIL